MIQRIDNQPPIVTGGCREAAARCLHLVERRHGCGVICGEAGCGKTLVLRRMLRHAARLTHRTCYLDVAGIEGHEFLWRLCGGLRLAPGVNEHRTSLWTRIADLLEGGRPGRLSAAILIDHADSASPDVLPELRRWLHLCSDRTRTVTIIATRTPVPVPLLELLNDFCDLRADVHPLTLDQTSEFIRNFQDIGTAGAPVDQPLAETLHRLSKGQPRKLERLCRLARLATAAEEGTPLDASALEALARELGSLPDRASGVVPRS